MHVRVVHSILSAVIHRACTKNNTVY